MKINGVLIGVGGISNAANKSNFIVYHAICYLNFCKKQIKLEYFASVNFH